MTTANTLTGLIPTLYDALDVVSRELIGFIPAVFRNSSAERAALNQSITYPVVPAATTNDITPGQLPVDDGNQTIGTGELKITKSKYSPVVWNGEQARSIGLNGMINPILRDQFAQSMRALVNLVEADLFAVAYKGSSRAYGTAGTAPFGSANDLSDGAQVRKILEDNGCPQNDLHLVMGSSAMANIRGKQSVLFKVNEAGTAELLRRGTIGELQGFGLHNSSGVQKVTKGGGSAYVENGAAAIGATTVVAKTGSGTVLAGDVITIANGTPADSNKYIVNTGIAAPGSIILNKPGLLSGHVDSDAISIGNDYTPNMAFGRHAIHLITRAPAMPEGGDEADDVMEITDPVSGLSFQVAVYRQYRQVKYEVGIAWGCGAVKSEHIATLMG